MSTRQAAVPTQERRTWRLRILVGISAGLLAAGAAVITAHRLQRLTNAPVEQQIATYSIGDCVTLTATASGGPHIAKSGCGADPSYTVGSIARADAACPGPTYMRYAWTDADTTVGALCLAQNLRVGHCYQPGPIGAVLDLVDCAAVTSNGDRVTQRLDNVSDVTQCPPNTTAYAYPVPARTYCLMAMQPKMPV
jgi:hypothetical protein